MPEPPDDQPPAVDDEEPAEPFAGDEADAATGEPGNVFGPHPDEPRGDILPGEPDPEHVAFVALGVAVSLLLVADLVGLL
jgi:hypothetical protein